MHLFVWDHTLKRDTNIKITTHKWIIIFLVFSDYTPTYISECGTTICEANAKKNHTTCECSCPGTNVYTGKKCERKSESIN